MTTEQLSKLNGFELNVGIIEDDGYMYNAILFNIENGMISCKLTDFKLEAADICSVDDNVDVLVDGDWVEGFCKDIIKEYFDLIPALIAWAFDNLLVDAVLLNEETGDDYNMISLMMGDFL